MKFERSYLGEAEAPKQNKSVSGNEKNSQRRSAERQTVGAADADDLELFNSSQS